MTAQPDFEATRRKDDQRLESVIGHMLRTGVTISALTMLTGGVVYLRHAGPAPDYMHFHSAPREALSIRGTLAGVAHGSSLAIIQLGILLLIATPVVRVLFALVGFLLEKDRLYTVVSAIVLAILLFSFTAGLTGVDMAYGNDRDLMAWLFDKAINSETAFVTIKNATEYLRETGKQRNGDRVKEPAARLRPLSGLVIGIARRGETTTRAMMLPMIASSNLPHNLTFQLEAEKSGQKDLPGLENPFGIQLEERFFQDIKRHHVAIPRRLWLQLQGQKGGPTMKDLLTFFVYRCYCAQRETIIPWSGLREHLPQDDSNARRLKSNVKKAIKQLRILWPEVRIDAVEEGVWVAKAPIPLLPDDPSKKRVRRLDMVTA